jgi:hypothetical protein
MTETGVKSNTKKKDSYLLVLEDDTNNTEEIEV